MLFAALYIDMDIHVHPHGTPFNYYNVPSIAHGLFPILRESRPNGHNFDMKVV